MSEEPVAYRAAVLALARREENLEGIPVFLALEDASAPAAAARRDADGRRLGRLALGYLQEQLAGREEATLDDVALVLAVLGAHHFEAPA